MRRIISFMALVTGVAACGPSPPGGREASPSAPSLSAEPLPPCENYESGLLWCGGVHADRGWLAYFVPETDDVRISMECAPGQGRIRIRTFDPTGTGERLVLRAGDVRESLPAEPIPIDPEFGDGVDASAEVFIEAPVLQAFRNDGVLAAQDGSTEMIARSEMERGAIAAFFDYCESNLD